MAQYLKLDFNGQEVQLFGTLARDLRCAGSLYLNQPVQVGEHTLTLEVLDGWFSLVRCSDQRELYRFALRKPGIYLAYNHTLIEDNAGASLSHLCSYQRVLHARGIPPRFYKACLGGVRFEGRMQGFESGNDNKVIVSAYRGKRNDTWTKHDPNMPMVPYVRLRTTKAIALVRGYILPHKPGDAVTITHVWVNPDQFSPDEADQLVAECIQNGQELLRKIRSG